MRSPIAKSIWFLPILMGAACAPLQPTARDEPLEAREAPSGNGQSPEKVQFESFPPRGSREYAHKIGRPFLIAERWEEAGEVYGTSHVVDHPFDFEIYERISLVEEVLSVWDSHADWPPREQDRFHYRLLHFLFEHVSLLHFVWQEFDEDYEHEDDTDISQLERLAAEYQRCVERLPEGDLAERLDFSHMDLLKSIAEIPREDHTAEVGERIFEALRTNPSSIPAITALVYYSWGADADLWDGEGLSSRTVKLALARMRCAWDPDSEDQSILAEAWELAPSREEEALLLGWVARIELENDLGKAARVIYTSYPDTHVGQNAGIFYLKELTWDMDPEEALAAIQSFEDEGFGGGAAIHAVRFLVGRNYHDGDELDKAESVFLKIAEDKEWSLAMSDAMYYLAWIHEERGEREEQVRWLERASEREPNNPDAVASLAEIYEAEGRWADAARAWERYNPDGGGCGTCWQAQMDRLRWNLAWAQAAAGEGEAVVMRLATYLAKPHPQDRYPLAGAVALYRIYRAADQIGDFRGVLRNVEEVRFRQTGGEDADRGAAIPYLAPIYDLGTRREVAALLEIVRHPKRFRSRSTWEGVDRHLVRDEAVDALARCEKEAVVPLRRAAAEQGMGCLWMVEALGRNSAPESLAALEWLAGEDPPDEKWFEIEERQWRDAGDWMDGLFDAIARKGGDGEALLQRLAADPESPIRKGVRKYLKEIDQESDDESRRPPVPHGSLPREIKIP